jgi:hypothetical protein
VDPHWITERHARVLPRTGEPGLDGRASGPHGHDGRIGGWSGATLNRQSHIRLLPHLLRPGSSFGPSDVHHAKAVKAAEHDGEF